MATHGAAREDTIRCLRSLTPFNRSSFAMTGMEGATTEMGRLDPEHREQYNKDATNNGIVYTVKSYATPIAWVTRSGQVRIPSQGYSTTTSHHQSLCRAYLNQ